jgi:hypothetical protein
LKKIVHVAVLYRHDCPYSDTSPLRVRFLRSLIHVPINIPAFAISTDVETDMNAEVNRDVFLFLFALLHV